MLLVDTSVWVDHLRDGEPLLVESLEAGEVLSHPFVIGELACGRIVNRAEILSQLDDLPQAPVATAAEALHFIDANHLMGQGIGYVDVHLLASAALGDDVRLWTRDRRLRTVAEGLRLSHSSSD